MPGARALTRMPAHPTSAHRELCRRRVRQLLDPPTVRAAKEAKPGAREHGVKIGILGVAYMAREPFVQVGARGFTHRPLDVRLRVATSLKVVGRVGLLPAEAAKVAKGIVE